MSLLFLFFHTVKRPRMFQAQYQVLEEGGGAGYGEVLAPMYESAGQAAAGMAQRVRGGGGSYGDGPNPNAGMPGSYNHPPTGQYAQQVQGPNYYQQTQPQYAPQTQSQQQVPQTYYSPPPPMPVQYDALLPSAPDMPAASAPAPPRRGLLNTSTGRQTVNIDPHAGGEKPCAYCRTQQSHHKHHQPNKQCSLVAEHLRTCSTCSNSLKSNNRFLFAIIALLALICLILWIRLGRAQSRLGQGQSTSLGRSFARRRQPYLEATKLGRLLQQ